MDFVSQFLLALSLTADTFAVSITVGLMVSHIKFWQAAKIASTMALVQGVLPFLGWLIGFNVRHLIADFDHWVALILLVVLGVNMIREGLKHEDDRKPFDPFKATVLLALAFATSIDAFVVGVSLGFTDFNIYLMVAMIGLFTFIVAMLGMLFGKTAGRHLSHRIEILGGLVLIGLGIKIVIEHYC